MNNHYQQILPAHEKYCVPHLDEIKFIGHRQTMGIVMGSCISTVCVGKKENTYVLSANHIVIAKPNRQSIIARKSAEEQIDEILNIYHTAFAITKENILCLHLIGAGSKNPDNSFTIPQHNITETIHILHKKNLNIVLCDTGSYFYASFSLYENLLSAVVENKQTGIHKSYTIDLTKLFQFYAMRFYDKRLPASSLQPSNEGFELLVDRDIIIAITGERD